MKTLIVRVFQKEIDYELALKSMQDFTKFRNENTLDELWVLEHDLVFTKGHTVDFALSKQQKNLVVKTDRGGEMTCHAPGQIVMYILLNIKKQQINTRDLVRSIEGTVIECLYKLGIYSSSSEKAPGVYIGKKKICSVGLRIKRGYSYHGLSLNVDMDLSQFLLIKPCGFDNIIMSQFSNFDKVISSSDIREIMITSLANKFKYDCITVTYKEKLG